MSLVHRLDGAYEAFMENLHAAECDSDFDREGFLLHLDDRFGGDVVDWYVRWFPNE